MGDTVHREDGERIRDHRSREEIIKARKDHVENTLAQQKVKQFIRGPIDSNFVCLPIFHNDISDIPVGPFFTGMQLLHSHEDLAAFNISSLEKSYTWRPHFEHAGLKLDLVDQDEVYAPDYTGSKPTLHPADARLVSNKHQASKLTFDKTNKPWWLRNTVYLENNLYKSRVVKAESKVDDENSVLNPCDSSFIAQSFELAKRPVSGGKTVEWSLPLLPADFNNRGLLSFVRFDESYEVFMEVDGVERAAKRRCVLANARMLPAEDDHNDFALSLLAAKDTEPEGEAETVLYDWVRDYRMDIRDKNLAGAFVLTLDPKQSSCRFAHLHSRIEMHKLATEDSAPVEAFVSRRDFDDQLDGVLVAPKTVEATQQSSQPEES